MIKISTNGMILSDAELAALSIPERNAWLRAFDWDCAQQEARAEMLAEQAYERALEDRGYWEARAQEDWEASRGVVPFDVARAIAEQALV